MEKVALLVGGGIAFDLRDLVGRIKQEEKNKIMKNIVSLTEEALKKSVGINNESPIFIHSFVKKENTPPTELELLKKVLESLGVSCQIVKEQDDRNTEVEKYFFAKTNLREDKLVEKATAFNEEIPEAIMIALNSLLEK